MKKQKFKVLLDLSLALNGYCGIAQDVRLLFKTLASSPDVEVTGLVAHSEMYPRSHKFCSANAQRGDRLANQAAFLWKLAEGGAPMHGMRSVRLLQKVHRWARTRFIREAQTDMLQTDKFWSVLWRLLFTQTLSAEDMPLIQQGRFLLGNGAASAMYSRAIGSRTPLKLNTEGFDFFISQIGRPYQVSRGTRQIVRYHDMIPVLQPDTAAYCNDIRWHHKSIRQNLDSFYVCNSEPTRGDLTKVYPSLKSQSVAIPYMLSDVYRPDATRQSIRSIIELRRSDATGVRPARRVKSTTRYIMSVSTLEPRKNFVSLIQAYNTARLRTSLRKQIPHLKLLIVGNPGWRYAPILDAMRPLVERGDLIHLERVTADELRVLYANAEAFVFPSKAEGFGFPPLEAMLCDTPVIASDIPSHRWVIGDAALYVNPYDVSDMSRAIERLLASDESSALRAELVERGRNRVELYSSSRCTEQWLDVFRRLKDEPAALGASTQVRHPEPKQLRRVA